MKTTLLIFTMMATATISAQSGKAKTEKKTFSRETTVSTQIDADAAVVWSLLTNASDIARWNSTVVSLEGEIKEGEKIRLKSTLDEKRTFKLKVKEMIPEQKLVWGDSKGNRTYLIEEQTDGSVVFRMTEKIGGLMFPMYAKYIPPFDESFEQFASDLKNEAEIIFNSKN